MHGAESFQANELSTRAMSFAYPDPNGSRRSEDRLIFPPPAPDPVDAELAERG